MWVRKKPHKFLKLGILLIVTFYPLIFSEHLQLASPAVARSNPFGLEALDNGSYQFCSKPQPQDGRDGDGVCFVFAKLGGRVDGYYGYPHSEMFVCVRGQAKGNRIIGYGLVLTWSTIKTSEYTWRLDKHLTLQNGYVVRSNKGQHGELSWVQFDDLNLNIDGFYPYPTVNMRSSSQMCEWETS